MAIIYQHFLLSEGYDITEQKGLKNNRCVPGNQVLLRKWLQHHFSFSSFNLMQKNTYFLSKKLGKKLGPKPNIFFQLLPHTVYLLWQTNLTKVSLTACSLAPMYLLRSSGPLMLIKLSPHSRATTPARRVFPVPGAPYSRRPERKRSGQLVNRAGYWNIQGQLVNRAGYWNNQGQ